MGFGAGVRRASAAARRRWMARWAMLVLASGVLGACVSSPSATSGGAGDWPARYEGWRTAGAAFAAPLAVARGDAPRVHPDTSHQKIGRPYQINGVWYYPARQDNYRERGVASWYGHPFHGRKTANGERYDMNLLTAAHTTLPLPSLVRVTNLENGRALTLRVNDRGPFADDRIIDVSREAARRLGFESAGLADVRVEYLGPAAPQNRTRSAPQHVVERPAPRRVETAAAPNRTPSGIYVQAAAFRDSARATAAAAELSRNGSAVLERARSAGEEWKRVLLGPWREFQDAEAARAAAARAGYADARIVNR